MTGEDLAHVAWRMMGHDKGLLAIDESIATCNRRFAALFIAQTPEMRRDWRELILTTPDLGQSIGAVILCDETIRQSSKAGVPFVTLLAEAGILPGIKVDLGAVNLAGRRGEKITEGLDGLAARLRDYAAMGARFAKWRALLSIGDDLPSRGCIEANAQSLARYAALCQDAGLVPVVEPEVLMAGRHDLARCAEVTETVLRTLFRHTHEQGVAIESLVLKPNMILAGTDCPIQPSLDEEADTNLAVLLRAVPAAVPAIAFLSGGQRGEDATARLNVMNERFRGRMPWQLAFSFGRAIQQPALELWQGRPERVREAQAALALRLRCNHAARSGSYEASMERALPAAGAARPARAR